MLNRLYRLGFILSILALPCAAVAQTVIYSNPGPFSYTNTDAVITNTYPVAIGGCSSVSVTMDYEFSLDWLGAGNMESNDECPFSPSPCAGNPAMPSAGSCATCWDFLWARLQFGSTTVDAELIGVNPNLSQMGSIQLGPICTGTATNATVNIQLQNWASDETTIFSNIQVQCWEDAATLSAMPTPSCLGTPIDLDATLQSPGDITSTTWTGPGSIVDPSALNTSVNNAPVGTNTYTLTTTDANSCTGTSTVTAQVFNQPNINPPTDPTVCNSYTLPAITGTNIPPGAAYFTGPGGTGTQYNPGQAFNTLGVTTLYLFASGGNGCEDEESITITVNQQPNITDLPNQSVCGSFTLPNINGTNLTGNQAYFSAPNGGGSQYFPGDDLTTSGTYYIYDGVPGCSDQESFTLTIQTQPTLIDPSDVFVCSAYTLPTIAGFNLPPGTAYWSAPGGTGTQYLPGQTINTTTTLYIYASAGPGCFDLQDLDITINAAPNITDIPNTSACGSYTMPPITGTNLTGSQSYYTGPNGTGTVISPGSGISTSGTYYIYDSAGPGCTDQESFTLTINSGPSIINPTDPTACGSYTLPPIAGTSLPPGTAYFTQPNGAGTMLMAGASLTSSQTLYLYANAGAGCTSQQDINITINQPPVITPPANITSCGTATLPVIAGTNLSGSQAYYTSPGGVGTAIAAGTGVSTSGTYYAFDQTAPGCTDQESFTVTITPGPSITDPTDPTVCGNYTLPPIAGTALPAGTAYFTQPNGTGTMLMAGTSVTSSQTLYLYANAGAGCTSQQDIAITINQPPVITPPANITSCGTATLPVIAGTNLSGSQAYYTSPGGVGTAITAGTGVSTSGTYYAFDQTAPGCSDEESFTVTITPGPSIINPTDPTVCGNYTLPPIAGTALPPGTAYFTQPNGAGNMLMAGASITSSQTLYLYANAGAGCTSQQEINITINQPPVISPPANITACGTATLPVIAGTNLSGSQAYYTSPGGVGTAITAGTGVSTSGTYYAFDQTAPGCSDEESFTVTITPGPSIINPTDPTVCGSYTLPPIAGTALPAGTAYFTQPNGAGTMLMAGASVTSSQTLYLYANAGAGCTSQQDIAITINQPPVISPPSDITACGTATLPVIAGTNLSGSQAYYTSPGGVGTALTSGTGVSTSGTYYAFDQTAPGCSDEESFTVTITPGPSINNPTDPTVCGNYTLPPIAGTALPAGTAYFTQPNGAGTMLMAGASVTSSQTLYLYANAGAGCTSQQDINITINQPPVITPPSDITACGTATLPVIAGTNLSGSQAYYTSPGGVGTAITAGTGVSASGTYYAFDQTAPGCSDQESFTVTITPGPSITNPTDPTVCGNYTLPSITGTALPAGTAYFTQPNGAGNMLMAGDQITTSQTLYLYANAGGGCTSQQDLVITISNAIVVVYRDTLCSGQTATVGGQVFDENNPIGTVQLTTAGGCDSTIQVNLSFSPQINTQVTQYTCNPNAVGVFTQTYMTSAGCDSVVQLTVLYDMNAVDTTMIAATTCDPNAAGTMQQLWTNAVGCDSLVITTTTLLPGAVTNLTVPTCDPALIGTTSTQILQTTLGCDSTVNTQYIQDPAGCAFQVNVQTSPTPCQQVAGGSLRFTSTSQIFPVGYDLVQNNTVISSGSLNNASQQGQVSNLNAGQYTLVVFAAGDTITQTVTISSLPTPTASVAVSDFNGFGVGCEGDQNGSIQLDLSAFPQPVSVLWADGSTDIDRTNLAAGDYMALVSYGQGCTVDIAATITEPPALVLDYAVVTQPCTGTGGELTNLVAQGGAGPLQMSLNQVDITGQATVVLSTLTDYTLTLSDANGCTTEAQFSTSSGSTLTAVLTPDTTEINAGDSLLLEITLSDPGAIAEVVWNPVSCNCLSQMVGPIATTTYTALVTDTTGCSVTVRSVVFVKALPDLQIPNVFKPNSLDNEFWYINVPDFVLSIDGWAIFDRWGDQVWGQDAPRTDRYLILWDGRSARGKEMNPGVYVYWLRGTKRDGTKFVLTGDVTIVR